jgi:hypothetical protein
VLVKLGDGTARAFAVATGRPLWSVDVGYSANGPNGGVAPSFGAADGAAPCGGASRPAHGTGRPPDPERPPGPGRGRPSEPRARWRFRPAGQARG